ncbi:MAG: class I SAM-dependent methyltransferase [Gemmatimonadales bacterium]
MNGMYTGGMYLQRNPNWHVEDSPWKASQICRMLEKHQLKPQTVCEIGCGAGEILSVLREVLPSNVEFHGYDISPPAFELARQRSRPRLEFHQADLLERSEHFDLVLTIDVIEHVEDVFGFLRRLQPKGTHHIFHIPLDMTVSSVLRGTPLSWARENLGHVHFFSVETATAILRDAGYTIVDYFYTAGVLELGRQTPRQRLFRIPTQLAWRFSKALTAKILSGFSVLVLAR